MTPQRGRAFLHTPGPTNIPDRILNAAHRPAVDFAAPDFQALATSCFQDLKKVFQTADGEVFVYTASGHGAWEAAIVNLCQPGDHVLMPETGRFSLVWLQMAEALGIVVRTIPNDWRHAIDPAQVTAALAADKDHRIKAVLVIHTETATGVTSPVLPIRKAIDAAGHPALLVVDAIASLLTVDLPMDAWGVDVVIAASQKGLMMQPGLSFTAVSPKAFQASERCTNPREYWSWTARMKMEQYRRFCGTPPEHLMFALRESLDMIAEEGLPAIFARHAQMAEAVRRAVAVWSQGGALSFNAPVPEQRSNSITCVLTPDGVAEPLRTLARDRYGVAVGGGHESLAGRAFRIGHMGWLNEPMIVGAIAGLELALREMAVPHGRGGVAAAVDWLAEAASARGARA